MRWISLRDRRDFLTSTPRLQVGGRRNLARCLKGMNTFSDSFSLRIAVSKLASQQFGVISRKQLRNLGASSRSIDRLIETGRIHRIHQGVYLVGHTAIPAFGRDLAAVMAAGDDSYLSHYSAARAWRILSPSTHPLTNVTSVGRRFGKQAGIMPHSTRRLEEVDRRRFRGLIPITSPARTVLDIAGVATKSTFEAALGEVLVRDLCTEKDLFDVVDRYPRQPGSRRLRRYLVRGLAKPTRSPLERKFLKLLSDAGIPAPETNYNVAGLEVDCYWPEQRLAVELDGRAFHQENVQVERDIVRDSELAAAKIRVIRISWTQVTDQRLTTANRLRRMFNMAPIKSLPQAKPDAKAAA